MTRLGEFPTVSSSVPIWLNGVECHGDEVQLDECEHLGWGGHECTHFEDAGVICSGTYWLT